MLKRLVVTILILIAQYGYSQATVVQIPFIEFISQSSIFNVYYPGKGCPGDLSVLFMGAKVNFFHDGYQHRALLGVDMKTQPGEYDLLVLSGNRIIDLFEIKVFPRDYQRSRIRVNRQHIDFDEDTQARINHENRVMKNIFDDNSSLALFTFPFFQPLSRLKITSQFGKIRQYFPREVASDQGTSRKPSSFVITRQHSGTDFAARKGTDIYAINSGRVVLARDFYLPGRIVIIDHGMGLYSSYMHIDKIFVKEGDLVTSEQLIGSVGMTGRVTGAHLHLSVHLHNSRVDPMALIW